MLLCEGLDITALRSREREALGLHLARSPENLVLVFKSFCMLKSEKEANIIFKKIPRISPRNLVLMSY